jgi:hypothetical protein
MSAKTKNILGYCVSGLVVLLFAVPSLTQAVTISIPNPLNDSVGTSIPGLIRVIIDNILLPIGGVVAVLMIMWAGFLYVTARGDTAKLKDARNALLWAVIGAAILLGAWVISQAIESTINQIRSSS